MRCSFVFRGLALSAMVFLVACSSSPRQAEPEVEIPKQYSRAFVSDISLVLLNQQADQEQLNQKKQLETQLPVVAKEAVESYEWTVESGEPGKRADLVRLKLSVQYDPGNRALRWLAGFAGAGKGVASAQAEAFDGASGALIASEKAEDTRRMGAFGGSFDGIVEGVVTHAIYKVIEKLYEIPRRAQ